MLHKQNLVHNNNVVKTILQFWVTLLHPWRENTHKNDAQTTPFYNAYKKSTNDQHKETKNELREAR